MSDENHRKIKLFPKRPKYAEDFQLRYRIKRGSRFVGDHYGGIAGDGLGDEGALPLAATKLVRIGKPDAVRLLRKELVENFVGTLVEIALLQGLVSGQHVANLITYTHRWMECERRLLKDQRDSATPDLPKLLAAGPEKIFAFK